MSLVSASFGQALSAAREAAGKQDFPKGSLYVVATPIGNLADISLRALCVLERMDALACEDTRHTQSLLRAFGLERPSHSLLAVHQHNEAEAANGVISRLAQGERIAYVSDAGTPAVSDPGARLVAAVRAAGHRVIPLPGASSVTALLSVAGVTGQEGVLSNGFAFVGFLPNKSSERAAAVQALAGEARALILLEAPHRIEDLAAALAPLGDRLLTLGRELTKQFEEVHTLPAQDLAAWLQAKPQRSKGEFALLIHPPAKVSGTTAQSAAKTAESLRVLSLLLAELPLKTAVRLAVDITGQPRNALYPLALQLKNDPDKGAVSSDNSPH